MIEEDEASGQVAAVYDEIKRDMQLPFIPNIMKALAGSPGMLTFGWISWRALAENVTLPESLVAMIGYTIATKSDCTYCSVANELTCRTLGIDENTLDKLVKDLGNVNPKRLQAIIDFALKVTKDPQGLVAADYDNLRDQGVSDDEIVEIIVIAANSVFVDILADALQIEVEPMTNEALAQLE
jgi:uncharacterized peroxidase-related enzyme